MTLTDAKIRVLTSAYKSQKFADGGGLFLLVNPSGSKLWRFAYRFGGKQKTISLGSYPLVSLSAARGLRDDARRMLMEGNDPSAERKAKERRKRVSAANTFGAVAEEWMDSRRRKWAESYASRLESRLRADLLPQLGTRPIAEIEPIEVLDVVRRIERREAIEMAKRVMQMASAIFRYGVATSRCPRDPTADLRGALQEPGPVKRRTALSAAELPEFLRRLESYQGDTTTRLALELIVLTFVRSAELRFARWSEFEGLEGDQPLWRIPAERMKMRRPHLVPLAPRAVEVLGELKRLSARSPFVFPSFGKGGVISENTMIFGLYRMGYHSRATVHGFRSTASTILNEHQFNRDWIEMQLAHSEGSVRSIYNAAEWLPGRREMMNWWADYLAKAKASAESLSEPPMEWVRIGRNSRWVTAAEAERLRRPRGRPPRRATAPGAKRRAASQA